MKKPRKKSAWEIYNQEVELGLVKPPSREDIMRFQAENGLDVDGVMGPNTLERWGTVFNDPEE